MEKAIEVYIDDKPIFGFKKLKLKETTGTHSSFYIDMDSSVLKIEAIAIIQQSNRLLNRVLKIVFGGVKKKEFTGIITNVLLRGSKKHPNRIRVEGYATTIVLEHIGNCTSWLNKPLKTIVNDLTTKTDIETIVSPQYKGALEYTVQYGESNWNYLQRLAYTFGEPLEYDGKKLYFGSKAKSIPHIITYADQLYETSIKVETHTIRPSVYQYHKDIDVPYELNSKDCIEGHNELSLAAFEYASTLYNSPIEQEYTVAKISEMISKNHQATLTTELYVLHAYSRVQGLGLGSIVQLQTKQNTKDKKTKNHKIYGKYKIIAITHKINKKGKYQCYFKAVPSSIVVVPKVEKAAPKSYLQTATVVKNNDPKGIGRVKVHLQWQDATQSTNWITVVVPTVSSIEGTPCTNGYVFVPEAGDLVMVGFQNNDPQRPYVQGYLQRGTKDLHYFPANSKKTIITHSRHLVIVDNRKEEEKIIIKDRLGNCLYIYGENTEE
jgi:uncharacterized protein involved in type VI secretion and phage assembly